MAYLLQQLLTASARRVPDKTAVVCGERSLSYRELDALTNQLARVLQAKGVEPGDRVGIYVPKSLASVLSVFGILKSGACYVPLDPGAPLERLAYIIQDSGITTLLTCTVKLDQVRTMFPGDGPLSTVLLVDCDSPQAAPSAGPPAPETVSWQEIRGAPAAAPPERAIETDSAYILYTSGSTGTPKGVMISHRNSLTFVDWAGDYVGLRDDDRVPPPLRPLDLRCILVLPSWGDRRINSRKQHQLPGDDGQAHRAGAYHRVVLGAVGPHPPSGLRQYRCP